MNASKAKGTSYESALRDYLTERGLTAERLVLHGSKDIGDLRIEKHPEWVIEAKNCAALDLSTWMDEAATESRHANRPWFCVMHKRRRRGTGDSYVTMPLYVFADVLGVIDQMDKGFKRNAAG